MATYYVDSNAVGFDDGSSWSDAWTSIESSDGTATTAGDIVLVASDHDEQKAGSINAYFTGGALNNPIQVISTNKLTGDYEKGASLRNITGSYDIYFSGNFRIYGIVASTRRNLYTTQTTGTICEFDDCDLQIDSTATASNRGIYIGANNLYTSAVFRRCKFDVSNASSSNHGIFLQRDITPLLFINCEFVASSAMSSIIKGGSTAFEGLAVFKSSKFSVVSGSATLVRVQSNYSGKFLLEGCEVPSAWSTACVDDTNKNREFSAELYNCAAGTLSAPALPVFLKESYYGKVKASSSVYRSSGASDGTTDYSFELETNADAKTGNSAVSTNEIARWVDSGSQTITVHVASANFVFNNEFWIEVESPSEAASPTSQSKFRTTKPDPLVTGTTLTSDSASTWTGSGVGTKQKIEVAISPTIAGPVKVRCYSSKPSTTVYVDPKISTDGNQRAFNDVLVDGDASGGGGGGATVHPLYAN